MNEVDWVIAAVLGLSVAVGLYRGVIREILALAAWAAGGFLALRWAAELGERLPLDSVAPVLRTVIAAAALVAASLIAFGLLAALLTRLLRAANLSLEDRAAGGLFGLLRGVLVVCVCVFLLSMTSAVRTGPWRNSLLVVPAVKILDQVLPYFPPEIAQLRDHYRVF